LSEPKLVSPLLDGFVMGNPMSSHDGIACHPAMKENTDEKYIVKIISVPASQVQLDALLLTGAHKDPAEAMDYFKDVADGILSEVEILNSLAPERVRKNEPMSAHTTFKVGGCADICFFPASEEELMAAMKAAQDNFVPMMVMLGVWCVIRLIYIYIIMHFVGEISWIYWAYPFTWLISSTIYLIYYLRSDWVHGFEHPKKPGLLRKCA